MATKLVKIRPKGTGDYADVLHPETSASVVKMNDGTTVEDKITSHLADTAPNPRGNQIYHVEVVSSSVSETPDAGRIIFDTSQGKFFGGNGTEWV